jgi:hypothetical protein
MSAIGGSSALSTAPHRRVIAGNTALAAAPRNALNRPPTRADDADCPFCASQLMRSQDPHDQVLARGPGFNLLPPLGMLTPGHLLVTAEEHLLSMAELGARHLVDLASWLTYILGILSKPFGHYLFFEHGNSRRGNSAACIDHAHIHLLPLADCMSRELESALPWIALPDYQHLAGYVGLSYVFLGSDGQHLVHPSSSLQSQWIRRKAANVLRRDDWDWCLTRDSDELERTLQILPGLPLAKF